MAPDKKDFDATAAAAEVLAPTLEKAAAGLEAELRSRPTPTLTTVQWEVFDSLRVGTTLRGKTARALEAAGLVMKAGWWHSRTAFGDEVARRRREGEA